MKKPIITLFILLCLLISVVSISAQVQVRTLEQIKWLNTRTDYEYVRANYPEEIWRPRFQILLDEYKQWINTSKLINKADGVVVANQKKIVTNKRNDGSEEHYQYEFKEDPNCKMKRLGFTLAEVQAVLQN